jgi:hypothetical protein
LEGIFPQIFYEFDDKISFFYLLVDFLANGSTLPLNKFMLRKLIIKILHHFMD